MTGPSGSPQASSLQDVPAGQWVALVLPPAAWCAHELASVYVGSALCHEGRAAAARAVLVAIAAGALVVAACGVVLGASHWKSLTHPSHPVDTEGRSRAHMLGLASLAIGLLFMVALLWAALPSIALGDVCGGARE